jgi:hypothetical protein
VRGLERARGSRGRPEALRFAMGNPDEVMKVVIHGE